MNKFLIFLIMSTIIFSCKTKTDKIITQNDMEFENKVISINLSSELFKETYFSMLLPETYEVETIEGEDFIVFYIKSNEVSIGGIYIGNHPSIFISKDNKDYILNTEIESRLMNKKSNWKVYFNGTDYFTEIIMKNTGNAGWNNLIHLWIIGKSIESIKQNILIYSTLENVLE
jgi:hypothetical protein